MKNKTLNSIHKSKKAMDIPIHWIILFVIVLLVMIAIAYQAFSSGDGLLASLFANLRGG